MLFRSSQGKEEIKRVHNKILGIKRTEDIVYGYKLKLKDNVFNMDLMQLIDGGKFEGQEYKGIPAGEVVDKDEFTLVVFSEELEYKKIVGYVQFTWRHCLGKAPKWNIKDGKFIVPEFNAESIPDKGEKPISVKSVKELPKDLDAFAKEIIGSVKNIESEHH